MQKIHQVMIMATVAICIYSVSTNISQTKQIYKIRDQVIKAQQMFGRSATFGGKSDMTYAFKVRIERNAEEPFEVPLFQVATGGDVHESVLICLFKLQTPKNDWFYRIRVEEESGGWSLHSWGSIEHIKDGYGLSEFEIEQVRNLLNNADLNGAKLENGLSLNSFEIIGEEIEKTKGILMVEASEGSVFSMKKGPSL